MKRCEERKWDKVQCLFGGGGFDCDAGHKFNVRGIPCCVLVSGEGIIQWIGHPMEHNVEADMNKLIGGNSCIETKQTEETH